MNALSRNPADRVVVVGAGVAGLATALRLAPRPVTVLASAPIGTGTATGWAQGGIAAAIGADDDPSLHAADTEAAGAGLTEPEVARRVAAAGPGLIDWLVSLGLPFDRTPEGALALGLEAAHGRRRIVRSGGDATGRAVLDTLVRAALCAPSIEIVVASAVDLMRDAHGAVCGVVAERDGARFRIPGRAVVLATGGAGGLYASTTNPRGALASGLALAARAGAVLRDLEFVQFHPTAIATGADPMPLATEALRGEGAVLVDETGARVMAGIEGGDLAPRDVVARGIFQALARGRTVALDARGALGQAMPRRFPTVAALCAGAGIDPARQVIPVRPAAHYHMGGIRVDAAGASSVPGLYACGEVASTGLHGANRLASNSLLEALAFAGWIADGLDTGPTAEILPETSEPRRVGDLAAIRAIMERDVGVVRDADGLARAAEALHALSLSGCPAALVGHLVARAALSRRESRGAHWRSDFPDLAAPYHSEVVLAGTMPGEATLHETVPAS
ncbi:MULTISPECIES: L-aspartate oxidase [Methylobacterium]|uniref:L-aspartate oxidase n=3 Tax=Pseudomonadota TaxID=1224 RepID=A0ABQ4SQN6_9HYPH|nr:MULTISPECIES: L-aspartate oxidase [Methylobacterium]PIU06668.1 MAG: L-aspartate oxidase [Methylobacterium sp. CG09_land_8_20_14_0_10_71_15]PIU12072.1 MAG: L-aspartate oxidase [Methylobacterium sp. CG08_land_8_20_14_0_20_71_15]GBU19244.1 L-aspartate oxidase [Methylobacterium sp.]GJE04738.1 L-aspartate oxidase [Methylobacterium jeotgali]